MEFHQAYVPAALVLGTGLAIYVERLIKKRQAAKLAANPPLVQEVVSIPHVAGEKTFAFYGDSITRGTYTNATSDQPTALLQAAIEGSSWIDGTMPGRRLIDFIPLITNPFFTTKYTVVEHGVIDAWQGFDVVENYRRLITRIRAEGSIPIVTGFSHQVVCATLTEEHLLLRAEQNFKLRALCFEMGVPFADWDSVPFSGAEDLYDGVHPNKPYSDRLVARLVETINQLK